MVMACFKFPAIDTWNGMKEEENNQFKTNQLVSQSTINQSVKEGYSQSTGQLSRLHIAHI